MLTEKSKENYLLIDNRHSDALPVSITARLGFQIGAGQVIETATLTCGHCQTQLIVNPWRDRERYRCPQHGYICDNCSQIMRDPDYVHLSFREVCDLVINGEAVILPGSTHGKPKILYVKGTGING